MQANWMLPKVGLGASALLLGLLAGYGGSTSGPDTRSRVIIVEQPGATVRYAPQLSAVSNLVTVGLTRLTDQPTLDAAWLSLVSTQKTLGVKVFSRPGAISGTRPPIVESVIRGLLAIGMPATNIVLWDHHLADLRLAGFVELGERLGVRVAGSTDAGFTRDLFYETPLIGQLVWGDLEFGEKAHGVGRRSFATRLLTNEVQQIISIAPLLNNNQVGVSGHCWGLAMASVDNTLRFESVPARLSEAVPEILAVEGLDLRDRVVLAITDAMLCQYQGEERQLLHYSSILDQLWFSTDPVALDVLAIEEIERQRRTRNLAGKRPDLILYENCSLLELGVSDTNRMDLLHLTFRPGDTNTPTAPQSPLP